MTNNDGSNEGCSKNNGKCTAEIECEGFDSSAIGEEHEGVNGQKRCQDNLDDNMPLRKD